MSNSKTLCGRFRFAALIAAAFVAVAALVGMRESRAVLVAIEYYDRGGQNPEFAGGPLWTGFVDTTTDTVEIRTWTELPLHGSEYWIPRDLPLVWTARTSTGALFDVPDTFDGHINDTFAFFSDQTLRQMNWLIPQFSVGSPAIKGPPEIPAVPPQLIGTTPGTFLLDALEFRPGWGGSAIKLPGETQFTFYTANPLRNASNPDQPLYDERIMPQLPVSATAAIGSTNATVTAAWQTSATAVPEARPWLMVGVALSLAISMNWWNRRRRLVAART